MWWYERGNSGGSCLPKEKKANMWHGRGNSGGSWPPAPSPARRPNWNVLRLYSIIRHLIIWHLKFWYVCLTKLNILPQTILCAEIWPTPFLKILISGRIYSLPHFLLNKNWFSRPINTTPGESEFPS